MGDVGWGGTYRGGVGYVGAGESDSSRGGVGYVGAGVSGSCRVGWVM